MENKDKTEKESGTEVPRSDAPTPQPESKVVVSMDTVSYDTDLLQDFLAVVFEGHDPAQDENVLIFYATNRGPGLPKSKVAVEKALKSKRPRPWYFGTSTCGTGVYETYDNREIRQPLNRKDLFKALYVVVLDDIGTKVSLDKVAHIKPTYIIESSPGNFQYGLVLEEPITDYEQAEALVRTVYASGFTDGGGGLVTKAVRLPIGVNGKPEHDGFEVKLTHMDRERLFTPQEVLTAIEHPDSWDEIRNDPAAQLRKRFRARTAAGPWLPFKHADVVDGVIDPMVEWLYDQELVVNDSGEFIDILCPWHLSHTTGDGTAGYSPLGRGDLIHRRQRGFHCFHDHCSARTSSDFLEWVYMKGGPNLPAKELVPELLTRLVRLPQQGKTYDLEKDMYYTDTVLPTVFPRKVAVMNEATGKVNYVNSGRLWLDNEFKLEVHDVEYMPYSPSVLATSRLTGRPTLNTCRMPEYSNAEPDLEHVARFVEFIEYLIPNEEERTYFLDWLAAKVQDPRFRGNAIVMVTPVQGTGRTTLINMITTMFGVRNCKSISFNTVAQGGSGGRFNSFLENAFVFCNETHDVEGSAFKAKERLKELIDPNAGVVSIERKGKDPIEMYLTTSFLLCSNHYGALKLDKNDRRFYVIENAHERHTPEFYQGLHAWIEERQWMPHLWNWLKRREITTDLHMEAPETDLRNQMIYETEPAPERLVRIVCEVWPGEFVPNVFTSAVIDNLPGETVNKVNVGRVSHQHYRTTNSGVTVKLADGTATRVKGPRRAMTEEERTALRDLMDNMTPAEFQALVQKVCTEYRQVI